MLAHLTQLPHDLELPVMSGCSLELVLSSFMTLLLDFFMQGETWVCEGAVASQVHYA